MVDKRRGVVLEYCLFNHHLRKQQIHEVLRGNIVPQNWLRYFEGVWIGVGHSIDCRSVEAIVAFQCWKLDVELTLCDSEDNTALHRLVVLEGWFRRYDVGRRVKLNAATLIRDILFHNEILCSKLRSRWCVYSRPIGWHICLEVFLISCLLRCQEAEIRRIQWNCWRLLTHIVLENSVN